MTTLILVRHGQSNTNLEQRFTGQGHAVLTELGHKQAECTAHYLDRYSIDVIYSSDLTRSMQTAEATARRQGRSVIPNANLREIDAGLWEGLPYAELKKTYPESYALWTDDLGRRANVPRGRCTGKAEPGEMHRHFQSRHSRPHGRLPLDGRSL